MSWIRINRSVGLIAAMAAWMAPSGQGQEKPKVAIVCRVLDDIASNGVSGARITLQPREGGDQIVAFTSESGACSFPKDVQPGQYVMSVDKAGYFPIAESKAIAFSAEAPKTDLGDIVLSAKRSIQGVVRWSNGDPADGVIAHVLVLRAGRAVLRPGDSILAMTNDRGEFRLENLRPATYLLYAYTLGFRREGIGRTSLPVFYPDLPAPNLQGGIDLRKMKEASGLTLTLKDAEGVSVSGVVTASQKQPEGSTIFVGLMIPENAAQPFLGTKAEVGKSFRLQNVPPGNYLLLIVSTEANNRSVLPITVGATPIEHLRVPFVDAQDLDCALEYEAGADEKTAPAKALTSARVSGTSDALQLFGTIGGRVSPEGRVHMQLLVPGYRYTLHVQPPEGAYVTRVLQGGAELEEIPPQISAEDGPVRVVLGRNGGVLSGVLSNRDGKPTSGFVVLAPVNPAKRDWVKTATTGSTGQFEITAIAPGKYRLFALRENDNDAYLDAKYLEQFSSREIVVTANVRQMAEIRLPPE
ncbi:carboxypeptidase-like regulatory domain-containing protein [Paludibaculum fermentans]|uniref:Carboxypeptidase regulatory-like domain-containing protein n=1 Tax=Paludibaculum fermentans TaxID=1473598 RepID=A0A7S7NV95_PALFE|nr:carboxypeptidase-like regulatory domain-containing protein [Paludibaculum fermentans]QOY90371.1 carboxypeptidase regulatory-like domain-containing protein [Paludibaculum fermentans]